MRTTQKDVSSGSIYNAFDDTDIEVLAYFGLTAPLPCYFKYALKMDCIWTAVLYSGDHCHVLPLW